MSYYPSISGWEGPLSTDEEITKPVESPVAPPAAKPEPPPILIEPTKHSCYLCARETYAYAPPGPVPNSVAKPRLCMRCAGSVFRWVR